MPRVLGGGQGVGLFFMSEVALKGNTFCPALPPLVWTPAYLCLFS